MMLNKQKFAFFLISLFILFFLGCNHQNLNMDNFIWNNSVTQVRRVVIFPFINGKNWSNLFTYFAEKNLWPKRVVSRKDVLREMKKIKFDIKSDYLSKEQAQAISTALGADAFVVGYIDDETDTLHIKCVNLTTQALWVRERQLNATNSMRIFFEEIKNDLINRTNMDFVSIATKKIIQRPNSLAILPIDNETVNLNADELFRSVLETRFKEANYKVIPNSTVDEVLKSTFAISDGGQLKNIEPEKLAYTLGVDGLIYTTIHDFTYQNIGVYRSRKFSATIIMKNKFGEVIFSKNVASQNNAVVTEKILLNTLIALATQLLETASNTQLMPEMYAAIDELDIGNRMDVNKWWEQFGEVNK